VAEPFFLKRSSVFSFVRERTQKKEKLMNYMINLKSLGLLLAWFALSPLAQAAPGSESEDRSNGNSAAENLKEVPAQAVTVDPLTVNPLQVALLKWGTYSGVKFPVGNGPARLAFDGTHIWVTNFSANTVTKLRASDGFVVGNYPGGSGPASIAFDGAFIWVGNPGIGNGIVTRLRASDGMLMGTVPNVNGGDSLVCDGPNVWVANLDGRQVTKVRTSDLTVQGPFSAGGPAAALAFDGANIWVANRGFDTLTKLRASDGGIVQTVRFNERFAQPQGVAFDGANIWAAGASGFVFKVRASDGQVLNSFPVGGNLRGIAFDGANIWVAENDGSAVKKVRASDGQVLGTFSPGVGVGGVAFDGANIWVACFGSNWVSKL
jgi:outer membrane protein assembly factor BamB